MEKRKRIANFDLESMHELAGFDAAIPPLQHQANPAVHLDRQQPNPEEEETPEQLQKFQAQSQDFLKHYESTLDQVRCVGELPIRQAILTQTSELPKNPSLKYPNSKPSLSITYISSQSILINWRRTLFIPRKMLVVETSNFRKRQSERARPSTSFTPHVV
jgi:hypothetical protein